MTKRRPILAVSLLAISCGAQDSSPSDPDGGASCTLALVIEPAEPTVATNLTAQAIVSDVPGVPEISWAVSGPDGDVDWEVTDSDGTAIAVTTLVAGTYTINASVMGFDCGDSDTVNVAPTDAPSRELAIRFTPLPGATSAPPQAGPIITVYEDIDHAAGESTLVAGRVLTGVLQGPGGALPAYLRLRSAAGDELEAFADETGAYSVRVLDLPGQSYELVVVPYGSDVAPARLTGVTQAQLDEGFTFDAGTLVTGTVVDADANPVAGATVALGAGSLPPVVVVTAPDGSFSAPVRADAGALALSVVPPASSTLPRLELGGSAEIPAAALAITIAATPTVPVDVAVTTSTGTPLPGARVTFIASTPAPGGSVAIDGGAPLEAMTAARVTAVADAAGMLSGVVVPPGLYEVVVEPPPGGVDGQTISATIIDLTTGAAGPVTTASARNAIVWARNGTDVVGGARVVAVARAIRGLGAGTAVSRITDAGGNAVLPVAPGVTYDVVVIPPRDSDVAGARAVLTPDVDVLDVPLADAIHVRGEVLAPSGAPLGGVKVEAFATDDGSPLGETISEPTGDYDLPVPSPRE